VPATAQHVKVSPGKPKREPSVMKSQHTVLYHFFFKNETAQWRDYIFAGALEVMRKSKCLWLDLLTSNQASWEAPYWLALAKI
jgi:hypothetical protein